jgi:PadR family transcriptional regulator PadR
MTASRRITAQTTSILEVLLSDIAAEWWGGQIAPAAGLKSGTLYPALLRMESFGWLTSRWEELDPAQAGRPRRRLYRLTGEGEQAAREIVERSMSRERVRTRISRPPHGLPGGAAA